MSIQTKKADSLYNPADSQKKAFNSTTNEQNFDLSAETIQAKLDAANALLRLQMNLLGGDE
jgi:hypothetical protein